MDYRWPSSVWEHCAVATRLIEIEHSETCMIQRCNRVFVLWDTDGAGAAELLQFISQADDMKSAVAREVVVIDE
jgi:hypothetical protein